MTRFLVREIRYAPGCWPGALVTVTEPDLLCPLCVLAGRNAHPTALLHHYISCQHPECGKLSAIYAADGLLSLCPTAGPTLLLPVHDAQQELMKALRGAGKKLRDIVVIDETRPVVTVSFAVPRIRLPQIGGGAQDSARDQDAEPSDRVLPGGVPASILKVLRTVNRKAGVA